MTSVQQLVLPGTGGHPVTADLRIPQGKPAPLIIFVHGFKGFKDWGHFNLVAGAFCAEGFAVLKINFSHNGVTPAQPTDFADPEAFGRNNFSMELDELGQVIDWLFASPEALRAQLDLSALFLLGHSRGGGTVLLKAAEDARVKGVVTWAGVADFEPRVNPPGLDAWKATGVMYSPNTRTGQDMPLYYQLREDFYAHRERLDIPARLPQLQQPLLVVHGSADDSVKPEDAERLYALAPRAERCIIEGANHTFGGKHPFSETQLPQHTAQAIEATLRFLRGITA